MSRKVVVIDNGAGSAKVGIGGQAEPIKVMPNCITRAKNERKNFIGDQISECTDTSSLFFRRPFEKGYVTNWEVQKEIWSRAFQKLLCIRPSEWSLLMTEPLFNPTAIQVATYEVVYEEYGFESLLCTYAPYLAYSDFKIRNSKSALATSPAAVLVDCGYSYTHVVPIYDNYKINHAVKRINIGGKALTNYLKEVISYRQWNMMDETHLVNDVKEALCYVSMDFKSDMETCRLKGPANTIRREYVLPDFQTTFKGYVKDPNAQAKPTTIEDEMDVDEGGKDKKPEDQQTLMMNLERITVPELLFNPSDVGIDQAGIPETIVQAVKATHPDLHSFLYNNVYLCGGCTKMPNVVERVRRDLRALVPDDFDVDVTVAEEPILSAWRGGSYLTLEPNYFDLTVSKADYQEYGYNICRARFQSN